MTAGKARSEVLLFAARSLPYPLDSGSRIRTNRLLTGLAETFNTTFVTFDPSPGDRPTDEELRALFPGIELVMVRRRHVAKRLAQACTVASSHSWEWGRYRVPAFRDALTLAARAPSAPIVHLDDAGVAQFAPVAPALNVFAPHDVGYRIIQGTTQVTGGPRRWFAELEWRKVKREEQRIWRSVPLCLAVSDVDAEEIRRGGARRVDVCPNGTDPVVQLRHLRKDPNDPLKIVFVGTGSYQPNERGLAWFIREVLPRVRQRLPVEFHVVGARPRHPIQARGVHYAGRVPTVAPWYERSHVVVVPVFEGSGTRLKIVEAMAYGRPVVSTTVGAEGLPVEPDVHFLRTDDADSFSTALVDVARRLEDDDDKLRSMIRDARAAITPLFWPNLVSRLSALYLSELEQRRALAVGATRR